MNMMRILMIMYLSRKEVSDMKEYKVGDEAAFPRRFVHYTRKE